MTLLDWGVLSVYLVGMVGLSVWVGRSQRTPDDYYLAGRRLGSWPVALSILATQISAISLVGGPAFVALKKGGGLIWLQYEFAIPLAMLVLLAVVVPAYHAAGITSIYELLDRRFGTGVRRLVSAIFLLSRGLANGIALYAASLVVAVLLGIPLLWTMLAMSGLALLYTTIGGIRADVYTDIIQLAILWVATICCCLIAIQLLGGFSALTAVPSERLQVLDIRHHGLGDGHTFSFWPMVLGGFFLYLSYYGCDQSQAQRLLTTPTPRDAQRSLLLNGLLRFPLAATYCGFGVLLAAFLVHRPDFAARVPADRPDELVPLFLLHHVSPGLRGLMVAGILAAAMSSFDSAFNSLSAVTVRDFIQPLRKAPTSERWALWQCRLWTLFWGLFCTAAAVGFSRSRETVIEVVNKVGSAFYGPILGVFLLALSRRRPAPIVVGVGLLLGVGTNISLWLFAPGVSWLWWNPAGFIVCFAIGWVARRKTVDESAARRIWSPAAVATLSAAFALMVLSCIVVETLVR